MPPSVLGFVIEHTDNCARCSQCDFCPTGIALLKAAAETCGRLLAGGACEDPKEIPNKA